MEWFYSIDVNILTYVQEFLRTASLTYFFEEITDLGNNGWFWIVLGCILTAIKRTRIPGILMLAALIVSGAVDNMVLKTVVDRTRPFLADPSIQNLVTAHGSSFPSGHTGSSFAAAGVMWRTMPRKYGLIAIILAALIGISRVYLGVHYPSDVLGGAFIGLLVATIVVKLYRYTQNRISVQ